MSFTYYLSNIVRFFKGRVRPYTAAVLLAGGSGSRMKSENNETKQMMKICGVPVVIHTLKAFESCKYIDEIVLVCREDEIGNMELLLSEYGIKKVKGICKGGAIRSESALLGVKSVSKKAEYVAIHDVARCLITPGEIADVVASAYAYRASSAGCRVKDTIKRVNSKGFIEDTPKREELWIAQTPQVFYLPLYTAASKLALEKGISVTDDNMIIESIGQRIKMVDTGYGNMKLTTREDLEYFETVIKRRRAEAENTKTVKSKTKKKEKAK